MLTAQSDVEELLNLVMRVGKSVEENSRVLDSMSEIVKRGLSDFFFFVIYHIIIIIIYISNCKEKYEHFYCNFCRN